jgi:hypothetical protein
MKSKLVLISLFVSIFINSIGQIPENKIGINASVNYAFLGDGDYVGFYFNNGISYSIKPSFQICVLMGFITSSNKGEDDIFLLHNNTHLLGDIYLKILPINTQKIIGYLGFGSTNRYRSEIRLAGISVKNGETISRYENEFSFDMGYLVQLGFGYKVSTKTMIFLNGELQDFNKGTSLYALGLGINFKL